MIMLIKIMFAIILTLSAAYGGTFIKSEINSKELNHKWNYSVYLPDDYNKNEKYPVVYLLHGNGDDEDAWTPVFGVVDSLIEHKIIKPVILVTPTGDRGWWINSTDNIENAIINELIPHIDAQYSTINNRDGRMISGYSMGGYGAVRYAMVYSEYFSKCAVFSPAIYNEEPPEGSSARENVFGNPFDISKWKELNYPASLKTYLSKRDTVSFFIGSGDDDWNHDEGAKYNVEYQSVMLYQQLSKVHGIPAELRIVNGGHNWNVWKPLFREAIQLFLRN